MENIKTFIQGTTSVNRINPDTAESDRVDAKTRKLIKEHNYLKNNPKDIIIYVARSEVMINKPDSYIRLHALYWSTNKSLALRKSKENLMKDIKKRNL